MPVDRVSFYTTCSNYLATVGRRCTGAWEEEGDTCTVQWTLDCDQANHDGGSDFICECAEVLDGAQACNVADWPDKDHGLVCGDCKVLVDRSSFYKTCSGYSATVGRRCTGAWEEEGDTCTVQWTLDCHQANHGGGSDFICECAEVLDDYHLAAAGANTCDYEETPAENACRAFATRLLQGLGLPTDGGFIARNWSHLPSGCSVASKGDEYWKIHYNRRSGGKNNGKHTLVCTGKAAPAKHMLVIGCSPAHVSPEFHGDRSVVLAAVQKGLALERVPPEFQGDPGVVLAAVQKGLALKRVPPEFQDDRGFVMAAVENGLVLECVPSGLQADRGVILAVLRRNGLALEHASPELRDDCEVVLAAVRQNSLALEHASPEFQGDRGLVFGSCEAERIGLGVRISRAPRRPPCRLGSGDAGRISLEACIPSSPKGLLHRLSSCREPPVESTEAAGSTSSAQEQP